MLASGLAAVVPSAVVGRRDAGQGASSRWCSSASARRVRFTFNGRRARCARVVPRHGVLTAATVYLLARLDAGGLSRRGRVMTSAFDDGTTASRARRSPKFERSPWRETADARTGDTHRATRAASRGAATTARAAGTELSAPVRDGSGKPSWIRAVLTAGPFAPGLTFSERAHAAGVVLTAVTLLLTCATIVAWTLGARTLSAALGAASLKAHLALVAETCARSVAPLPKTSRIAANAEPGFPDTRRARRRARRDANAFLVLDMFLTCVVALHTANVCGAVAFADPGVAAALALAWPAAIANWIGRLASETRWRVFDDVAVAVARKETTAMRRATRARRLGGLPAPKLPPPDAKRWRRIRYALALALSQWREAATCGSARAFRRVIVGCCVMDWCIIANVWYALGVVAAVADGTLRHVSNVSPATLTPLATFLFLDAARVAAQLFHARLLVDARVSSDTRPSKTGTTETTETTTTTETTETTASASPKRGQKGSRWRFFSPFGRALPAGMVAELTRLTYALNVWNLALTVVAGVFLGPVVSGSNASALSFSSSGSFLVVVRFVVVARFARLVAETAYLASALLAVVDRPRIVAEGAGARGFPMPSLRLDLRDLGVDGDLAGAVAERLAAARALAARLGAGFAKDGSFAGPLRAFVDASFTRDVGAEAFASAPPAMSLAEFTEAIAPGLRGYLVGVGAEAAAEKVFREIVSSSGAEGGAGTPGDRLVGLKDIQRWLAAQPSQRGSDGGGGAAADALSDVEKEIRWRRSVQRVLLRLARRAEYGRRHRGGDEGEGASGEGAAASVAGADAAAAEASVAKPRGLRLLSLEGGGIKGLALIWQLRALERAAGRPIHELFDLIGGVSTGGIIALGLARGVPLRELEKMYRDIGRDVFGSQSAVRRLIKGNAADNTAIRDLLLEYLGDLPMLDAPGQLARCFVVTTQQTERLEVRLVRTYRHPNKGRDQNEGWRQWEAGMATSSAPTVFPPFVRENRGAPDRAADETPNVTSGEGGETSDAAADAADASEASDDANRDAAPKTRRGRTPTASTNLLPKLGRLDPSADRQVFIDGALSGYNNPSSLVLNEGLDLAEQGQQIDVLLSLGCGEVAGAAGAESENGDRGLVFWLGQVVNLAFDVELQEAHVASLIQRFSPQTMHVRLNPPTGGVSLTEHRPEILHRMEQDTRQYLAENRVVFAEVAAALTELRGFADAQNAPSTPWDAPGADDAFWDDSLNDDFANDDDANENDDEKIRLDGAGVFEGLSKDAKDAKTKEKDNADSENASRAVFGVSGFPNGSGAFESFARERDRERVTRRDAKGASVTVRRGSADIRDAADATDRRDRRKKIIASAPVATGLDRFPSFPGPGTAKSAEAARRRAEAAKAFAEASDERAGWRKFFWGAGVKAARGAVDEDVGEVAEVQPVREQVALGEVPDVDTSAGKTRAERDGRDVRNGDRDATAAAVGASLLNAASAVGEKLKRAHSVSVKSWLDEGNELVRGWDDDAYDGAGAGDDGDEKASDDAEDLEPEKTRSRRTPRVSSADSQNAESASDAR